MAEQRVLQVFEDVTYKCRQATASRKRGGARRIP